MRVLLVVTGLPDEKYPARSVYNIKFAEKLSAKGIDVEILYIRSFNSDRLTVKRSKFSGLDVTELPCFLPMGKTYYLPIFVFLYKLFAKKADLVHVVNGGGIIVGHCFSNHFKVPLVVQYIGSDVNFSLEYAIKNPKYKNALMNSSFLTFNSNALKIKFESLTAIKKPSQVLYRGIDLTHSKPRENFVNENQISFLFLGGFPTNNPNLKGGLTLLESLAQIDLDVNKNNTFYIGGPNSLNYKTEFEFIKVIFIGAIEKAKLQDYFDLCNVVIIPSLSEGVPNVLFESMENSKLVLATKVGGIPEVLASEEGILISPNDINSLSSEISKLLKGTYDSKKMSKLAYKKIQTFSYHEFVEGYFKIYNKLVKKI